MTRFRVLRLAPVSSDQSLLFAPVLFDVVLRVGRRKPAEAGAGGVVPVPAAEA